MDYKSTMEDDADEKILGEIMDMMGESMAKKFVHSSSDKPLVVLEGKPVEDGEAQAIEGLAERSPEMDDHEGHLDLQGLKEELDGKGVDSDEESDDASPEEESELNRSSIDDMDDEDEFVLRAKRKIY